MQLNIVFIFWFYFLVLLTNVAGKVLKHVGTETNECTQRGERSGREGLTLSI